MNEELLFLSIGISCIIAILAFVFWDSGELAKEDAKTEAKKILAFRNTDHSCNELKRLYLKYDSNKYKSWSEHDWYWEARDKFIETGCIGKTQLDNLEFIQMCMDSHITGCEISKLKYPEAYENFNFRDSLDNINLTQWKKLGERT